jgi:enterochelin esterase family protein
MGGAQTINIAIPHPDKFAYVGVYSAGVLGIAGPVRPPSPGAAPAPAAPAPPPGPTWEEQHRAELDNAAARKGLKLLWFSTGVNDFLIGTTRATVDMLKKHGFEPVFQESPGAHTWINWRNYLNEFVPQLFQ